MKRIKKLWDYSPYSKRLLIIYAILNFATEMVGAHLIRPQLSRTITETGNLLENLGYLFALYLVANAIDIGRPWCQKHAGVETFIALLKAFSRKVLGAKYSQVSSLTAAKLTGCHDSMDAVGNYGKAFGNLSFGLAGIFAGLSGVYRFAGLQAMWLTLLYVFIFLLLMHISKTMRDISKDSHSTKKARNETLNNAIYGIAEVRVYGQAGRIQKELDEKGQEISRLIYHKNHLVQWMWGMFNTADYLGTVIAAYLSVRAMNNGIITLEEAITITGLVQLLVHPLNSLVEYFDWAAEAEGKIGDLETVLGWEDEVDGKKSVEGFNDRIEFRNVRFCYPDKTEDALNGVSFVLRRGERIAFVGAKGAGKSSTGKLLLRFYEPNAGKITMDGTDISELKRDSYAKIVGAVQQDSTIFDGTIRDNIAYGKPEANDVEILSAANKAGIGDFISKVGLGYSVGPNGNKLSGGQAQGIAIARMFLRNPQVIILDEATSNLDATSTRLVQHSLDLLSEGRSVIAIAHNLSTIKNFDRIYVIDRGRIVESGTHEQLLAANGAYAKLWNA